MCIYIYIHNDKKWNQKNMKECDKCKSHISSKLHMIYISSNNGRHRYTSLHCTQLHFTPIHYTSRHFTSFHLNFTQLHFTTLSFGLTPFKFPTSPFHLTSLHFTSLHIPCWSCDHMHVTSISPYAGHVTVPTTHKCRTPE